MNNVIAGLLLVVAGGIVLHRGLTKDYSSMHGLNSAW